MAFTLGRARSVALRFVAIALVLSLLSHSALAAAQIVISFAKEESTLLSFWYNSSGLNKLVQGQAAKPRASEKQANRDAKVARLQIYPGDLTIDLLDRVRFAAVPYDSEGNAVGGVKVNWSAQGSVPS